MFHVKSIGTFGSRCLLKTPKIKKTLIPKYSSLKIRRPNGFVAIMYFILSCSFLVQALSMQQDSIEDLNDAILNISKVISFFAISICLSLASLSTPYRSQ